MSVEKGFPQIRSRGRFLLPVQTPVSGVTRLLSVLGELSSVKKAKEIPPQKVRPAIGFQ
jgi:hypothetical protein